MMIKNYSPWFQKNGYNIYIMIDLKNDKNDIGTNIEAQVEVIETINPETTSTLRNNEDMVELEMYGGVASKEDLDIYSEMMGLADKVTGLFKSSYNLTAMAISQAINSVKMDEDDDNDGSSSGGREIDPEMEELENKKQKLGNEQLLQLRNFINTMNLLSIVVNIDRNRLTTVKYNYNMTAKNRQQIDERIKKREAINQQVKEIVKTSKEKKTMKQD